MKGARISKPLRLGLEEGAGRRTGLGGAGGGMAGLGLCQPQLPSGSAGSEPGPVSAPHLHCLG